jgi:phosphoglycolate phosphatase-like HAD superfamily hydrolase
VILDGDRPPPADAGDTRTRVVVFDFDGVILESGDIKTEAFLELFAEHEEHRAAIRRHHLENLGLSRFKKFEWIYQHLLGRQLAAVERQELGERFSRIVFEKVCCAPFVPGARESLEALAAARVPLIVASGTPQDELERIIKARGLEALFAEVYGTPNEKPEVLRGVIARYGCTASEIVFIGDGTSDADAAASVGVPFLARRTPELAEHWARVGARCVDDLRDLERRLLA